MGANGDQEEERRPTERVVLQRIRALVVPDDVTDELLAEALKDLMRGRRKIAIVEAWLEVDRNTALTKRQAITAYAGEPGTADAKVGVFRAPPVRAWKDGLEFVAPPKPLVEASVIE